MKEYQGRTLTYRLVTNVLIGISAGAAVAAAVIAIYTRWKPAKEKPAPVTILPGVAPGGGTLTLRFDY